MRRREFTVDKMIRSLRVFPRISPDTMEILIYNSPAERKFLSLRSAGLSCLKNHSRNLHAPLCGIFHPNSVAVAHYGAPHPGKISHKL